MLLHGATPERFDSRSGRVGIDLTTSRAPLQDEHSVDVRSRTHENEQTSVVPSADARVHTRAVDERGIAQVVTGPPFVGPPCVRVG